MITYDSIAAMKLNRYIFNMETELKTVNEQLKTGSTINKASDNPSVFNLTARVKGYADLYTQANNNVQNGITIVDTATSAISSMQDKLKSIKSILEEATDYDVTEEERAVMQEEIDALIKDIYDIKQNTGFTALDTYGGIQIFEKVKNSSSTAATSTSNTTTTSTESSTYIEEVTPKTTDDFINKGSETLGYETYNYGTSKTDGKVYYFVDTVEQLENISSYLVDFEGDADKNFILMSDMDLSDISDWVPIGNEDYVYSGIFDGNGYTISNLNVSETSDVGFFGKTDGATIKNVAIEDVTINGNSNVGALVGEAYNTTISNSYVKGGTVTGHVIAGGLVGYSNGSTIEKSFAELDSVTATSTNAGGLIGSSYASTISQSYADTDVRTINQGGGFIGLSTDSVINNSFAKGSISGTQSIGGFIGRSGTTTVNNSYSASETSGTTDVGGFIGLLYGNETKNKVNNSFFDTEATTQSEGVGKYDGSTEAQTTTLQGLTTTGMKTPSNFTSAGWDTDIWYLYSGKYPSLKEESTDPFPEKPDEPTYYGALKPIDGPIRIQSGNTDSIYVTIDTAFDFDDNFNFWATSQEYAKQSLKNLEKVQDQLDEKTYDLSLQKIQLTSQEKSTSSQVTNNNDVITALTGVDEDELKAQKEQLLTDISNSKALRASTINLNAQVCKTLVYGAVYGISSTSNIINANTWISNVLTT